MCFRSSHPLLAPPHRTLGSIVKTAQQILDPSLRNTDMNMSPATEPSARYLIIQRAMNNELGNSPLPNSAMRLSVQVAVLCCFAYRGLCCSNFVSASILLQLACQSYKQYMALKLRCPFIPLSPPPTPISTRLLRSLLRSLMTELCSQCLEFVFRLFSPLRLLF